MKNIFSGHTKAGIDSVRGAKLRSFWTMLGVIIGVSSVITVVSIGEGIKLQIGGQIHSLGQNLITIRPAQLTTGEGGTSGASIIPGLSVNGPLSIKDIDVIRNTKGVTASAPMSIVNGRVKADFGLYGQGYVIGTGADLPGLLNQSMAYGSFFGSEDDELNVAIVGMHASDVMFDSDVPLGRSFEFHGERFIVRGVFNQFSSAPLSQQADLNNAIFIPNDVAERLSNNTAVTYQMLARPSDPKNIEPVVGRLKAGLNNAHGGQSGFEVVSGNQNLSSSDDILNLLTRSIAGVAAISLLVGGVGIMNVMLVSVAERMHEIGIRKAIGATNRQIMSQFMIEATMLSLSGGIIGIGLAFAIDLVLRVFTNLQPSISLATVIVATGVSLLVGIIFGTVPAFKAARKDPIEALRAQ